MFFEKKSSEGYALVLVLVGIAVLSLIMQIVLFQASQSAQAASDGITRLRLQFAVRAGISEGILSLVDPDSHHRWPIDGTPRTIIFNDIPVTVTVSSESGKIDLNTASPSLLSSLFSAAGLDQTDMSTMVDRVLDWREPGDFKRLNGAKAPEYLAAGLPYGPRGGHFQSVDELQLVLGMTNQLYVTLAPGITVYNPLPGPMAQAAPPIVLRAVGLHTSAIDAIMTIRAEGGVAPSTTTFLQNQAPPIPGLPSTVFTVQATARTGSFFMRRKQIIRFTGNPLDPVWVLRVQ